jgi:hypothetical protein
MKKMTDRIFSAMINQLDEINVNSGPQTTQLKESIRVCKKAMMTLKKFVSGHEFHDQQEEIHFFKEIKPLFYSKYIFFINVYNFLMQYPAGGDEAVRSYINFHLNDLQRFFDNNKAFYQYYRSGSNQLDDVYFTRGGFDVQMEIEDFEEDEQYSTSHDYKLSKIIANEKFQDYLRQELARIGTEGVHSDELIRTYPFSSLHWTATPTDAIELIYALKSSGSVNNGNVEVSELVGIFEFIFQMEIKESYHKIIDISRRKKTVPIFLNKLTESLLKMLNDKLSA